MEFILIGLFFIGTIFWLFIRSDNGGAKAKDISIAAPVNTPITSHTKQSIREELMLVMNEYFYFLKPELKPIAIDRIQKILEEPFSSKLNERFTKKYGIIMRLDYEGFNATKDWLKNGGSQSELVSEFNSTYDVTNSSILESICKDPIIFLRSSVDIGDRTLKIGEMISIFKYG